MSPGAGRDSKHGHLYASSATLINCSGCNVLMPSTVRYTSLREVMAGGGGYLTGVAREKEKFNIEFSE